MLGFFCLENTRDSDILYINSILVLGGIRRAVEYDICGKVSEWISIVADLIFRIYHFNYFLKNNFISVLHVF